ncbi:hypothetical protein ISS30_08635 [bacterium]|nr:hypothetical protein [bacterium]
MILLTVGGSSGISNEKIAGVGVSGGLWAVGYALIRWAERQNPRIILGIMLGGILFRIFTVIFSIYFVREFTSLELMPFVVTILIFYLACEFALVIDYTLRR